MIVKWKETFDTDESIEKINTYEYEPHHGTGLNESGTMIRITIMNEDQFILPSSSHLYFEGELIPKTGNSNYDADECGISLVNNGLMYLFSSVEYRIANKKIEGYNNPGRATTMKGLLTYPRVYPEGLGFMWGLDEKAKMEENDGFMKRCKYIHSEGNGKFSALIPLSHIFGFCENFDKVMYGSKHEITFHRKDDVDAIFRNNESVSEEDTSDKVRKGKLKLTKLSWKMPIIKLSDEAKVNLYTDIQNKVQLPVEFLKRDCESIQLNAGQKHMLWNLSFTTGKPRFVIVAFQKAKLDRDAANSAVFDNLGVQNIRIEYNGEHYPEQDLNLDFKDNRYITAYHMLTDFFKRVMSKESCAVRVRDFKSHYSLFVFDISRQRERLKDTISDIIIRANFDINIPQNTHAYALILSDRELKLQSDGNRMHVLE